MVGAVETAKIAVTNIDFSLNPLEICVCGALATGLGDLVLHPIDTIKTGVRESVCVCVCVCVFVSVCV